MAQWDPWREMEGLRREIDRAFEQVGLRLPPLFRSAFLPARAAREYPLFNLYEDKDTVYVEALAPGLDPASLNVSVVRNTVTISGEKKGIPDAIKSDAVHREERAAGRFTRTLELPVEVDENKVQAEYKHGLLLLTLPKAEQAKPKQISVQVA
ncbi:MAG TPA: Hsp20/alpha crystallin family protein [Methylomirabilota bacterium]|nr:Hsp20/alpha crystallin family protein [Methylomirabilota bacterium]